MQPCNQFGRRILQKEFANPKFPVRMESCGFAFLHSYLYITPMLPLLPELQWEEGEVVVEVDKLDLLRR